MVLETSSFGFPQQSYSHKEESHYNDGFMQNNGYYGNSSSMQMTRPAPNHYSHGGFSNHSSHNGYGGGSKYSSGMYSHSQNGGYGAMNHGFGSHQSSHMSMGPGGYQYQHQNHGHNTSSSPFHNSSHSWSSKDLDD